MPSSPIDEGWTVDVRCPHGERIRGPLDLIRGGRPLTDPCPFAQQERVEQAEIDEVQRPGWFALWRATRRARRQLRSERPDWL